MLYRFFSHFPFLFYFHILHCVILIMSMIYRSMIMGRRTGCRGIQLASIRFVRAHAEVAIFVAMGYTATASTTAIAKCMVYCYC